MLIKNKKIILLLFVALIVILGILFRYKFKFKSIKTEPTITPTQVVKNYKGVAIQPYVIKYPEDEQNASYMFLGITSQGYGVFFNYRSRKLFVKDAEDTLLEKNLASDSRLKDIQMASLSYTDSPNLYKLVLLTSDSNIYIFDLVLNKDKASLLFTKHVKSINKALYVYNDLINKNIAWIVSINPKLFDLQENYDQTQTKVKNVKDLETNWVYKISLLNLKTNKVYSYDANQDYVPFAKLDNTHEIILPSAPINIKTLAIASFSTKNKLNIFTLKCQPDDDYTINNSWQTANLILLKNTNCIKKLEENSKEGDTNQNNQNNGYQFYEVLFNKKIKLRPVNLKILNQVANLYKKENFEKLQYYSMFSLHNHLYVLDGINYKLLRFDKNNAGFDENSLIETDLSFLKNITNLTDVRVIDINDQKAWIDILINDSILIRIYDNITT